MENNSENTPNESEQTPGAETSVQTTIEDKSQIEPKRASDEILFGTLSYFNIAVLATIVSKPDSEFCKFHAKQGVALVILDLAFIVVVSVAMVIVPFFAFLLFFIGMIILFAEHILGIINAIRGNMYHLPIIYGLAQKIDVANFLAPKKNVVSKIVPTQLTEPSVESAQSAQPVQPPKPESHGQDMVDRAVDTLSDEKHSRQ